jgi:PAS domain S-box-containing protein
MQLPDGENLQHMVLHAPIGICVLNKDTLVAEIVNDKFLEVAGKPYDAIFGQFYWDAFAEARTYYEAALSGVVRTGEAYYADEVELMLIRHGREENIFVTFVYAPVKDAKGKVVKIAVWVLENTKQVTERQKVEAAKTAFQQERDRLQNFFRQAPAGICILGGPELVFELVNPAYQQLLPGRQLQGRPLFEALPELVGTPLQEVILDVYRTGKNYEINELLIPVAEYEGGPTNDRYFSFTYQARRDEKNQVDGIMAFVFEVTAMIGVQHELQRARELADQQKRIYETISSSTPDLMYVFDLDYRFTFANAALLSMWGKTWENAVGKGLLENGYEPWHAEMHEREIDRVRTTKQPVRGEVSFPHATLGTRVYDYILTPVINEQGEVEAVAGTTRDITERKQWEQAMAQSSKELQAINEEILVSNEEQAASNEELAASNEELATTNEELIRMQQQVESTNRELAASTWRLRMAIESTNLGTWDYNPQTGELYWSKECRDIYGIPAGVLPTFTSFSDHLHPDDAAWVQKAIAEAITLGGGGHYNLSFRIIRFDNREIRWVKVHGNVFFEKGLAIRFVGTVLDISDIKVAEEQSAKLAAIIASSDDAIISKTLDSVITSWNDSAERIFGYTSAEMIGESIYKIIPEDRRDEEPQILKRLIAGERIEHFETKRRHKDGRLIDVSVTVSPVRDPQGHMVGLSKISRDISVSRRLLQELEASETRFRFMLNAIPQQVWTARPDGTLDYVNQVVCDDFGFNTNEIVGHGWQEFIHPDDLENCLDKWQQALLAGAEYAVEFRLRFHDGAYHWHLARAVPFSEGREIKLWLGTNTNIDPQKMNEQQKDEFLSIASHELKTPLTSIKAYNQVLQRITDTEKLKPFIKKSAEHIARLERLIADLLDVTKINAGKIHYVLEPMNMKTLLEDSIESIQQGISSHDIILESAPDIIYHGDHLRLEQVVHNFLSNAVKYSPGGAKILVNGKVDHDNIIVSVQDFGIGIARENLDRLFDRYYRVDNTAMRFEGLGLGLFISAEILRQHGGSFWIESEQGKGSTFYFRLPLEGTAKPAIARTETYYRDEHLSSNFNQTKKRLEVDWTGFQDLESVKHGCILMWEYLRKNRCDRVVNDNTHVMGNWSEATDWVGNIWFPMMEKAGLKYFAHVFSPSTFSQLAAIKSIDIMAGIIKTQYFTEIRLAEDWINAQ